MKKVENYNKIYFQTADLTVGAPRAAQDVATLRGAGGGIRGSKGGGWGLKLDALQGSKDKNADLNEAIDVILRYVRCMPIRHSLPLYIWFLEIGATVIYDY